MLKPIYIANTRRTTLPTIEEVVKLANEKGNNEGFEPKSPVHKLAKLALIVDEVAEEIHNVSKGTDKCDELVDVIIRIFSYVGSLGISTERFEIMIKQKHLKNKKREKKHGKLAN